MSARHTPGPWSLDRSEKPAPHKGRYWNAIMANVENEEIGLDGEVIIGEAFTEENAVSEGEAHANARLMASAPDLLHSLTMIAEWAETADPTEALSGLAQTAKIARAAIAKAEGSE